MHNRDKAPQKGQNAKIAAMHALGQAQRERKPSDMLGTLKRDYLKAARNYSRVLKRKGESRMRKECAECFWNYAIKVLDSNDTSGTRLTLSTAKAEKYFTSTNSSDSHTL